MSFDVHNQRHQCLVWWPVQTFSCHWHGHAGKLLHNNQLHCTLDVLFVNSLEVTSPLGALFWKHVLHVRTFIFFGRCECCKCSTTDQRSNISSFGWVHKTVQVCWQSCNSRLSSWQQSWTASLHLFICVPSFWRVQKEKEHQMFRLFLFSCCTSSSFGKSQKENQIWGKVKVKERLAKL